MLPIRPDSLKARIPECIECEGIEPTFFLRKPEDLIVNPFKKLKVERSPLSRTSSLRDEPRTALSQDCLEPRSDMALGINDRTDPDHESLPPDVIFIGFAETAPGDTHQLAAGSAPSKIPDFFFELREVCRFH